MSNRTESIPGDSPIPPANGLLSGMILTGIAAFASTSAVFLSPTLFAHFDHPLTPAIRWLFYASALVMMIHKAESFYCGEYDVCPVYLTSGRARVAENVRRAIFVSFVTTFLGMLAMVCAALSGPPWHLILIATWLGQGIHELHHSAKSLARGGMYPGVYSSWAFVTLMSFAVFPRWYESVTGSAERGLGFYLYYSALPLVFAAFYQEDRVWIRRMTAFTGVRPGVRASESTDPAHPRDTRFRSPPGAAF